MFVGMVLPGDQLNVKTRHIGMRDGNVAVKIETFNDRGEMVLGGTAEEVTIPLVLVERYFN